MESCPLAAVCTQVCVQTYDLSVFAPMCLVCSTVELCEFKASLAYKSNSRRARVVTQRNLVTQQNKLNKNSTLMILFMWVCSGAQGVQAWDSLEL